MKPGRRRTLTAEEREQALLFHAAVQGKPCVCCGALLIPRVEAHHVIEAQELRKRHLPPYDARNALPLCRVCHERHTNRSRPVPFRKLRAANIDYAYKVLGPFAADYLRRKYPMSDDV